MVLLCGLQKNQTQQFIKVFMQCGPHKLLVECLP